MTILWARIRSWHAFAPGSDRSYCGRQIALDADVHDKLPAGKSCESCLRIVARKADA